MPKPFFKTRFIQNFVGVGSKFSSASIPYDRRVDWVSRVPPPPPPPPPTFSILSRGGSTDYIGYPSTLDVSTEALIEAESGQMIVYGHRATITADQGIDADLSDISLTFEAMPCFGIKIPAFVPDATHKELVLWLDAQDLSTVIDRATGVGVVTGAGRKVSAWHDKSIYGNDVTSAASGNDPGWNDDSGNPDIINSHGTVFFNGVDEYLRNLAPHSAYDSRPNWLMFAVVKDDGGGDFYQQRTTAGDYSIRFACSFGTSDLIGVHNGTTYFGVSKGAPAGAHWLAGIIKVQGLGIRAQIANDSGWFTSSPISPTTSGAVDSIYVGARLSVPGSTVEAWFDGGVGELLVYKTHTLSDELVEGTINYLIRKWGL